MSAEGDHVRHLVAVVVEATNASETAAAVLAVGVINEQQGTAVTAAVDRLTAMVGQLRDELTALTYTRTGDGR